MICKGLEVNALRDNAIDRREQGKDAIVLALLDALERNAAMTQRHLARELGIALGLANTYLIRCVRKGLLKVAEVPSGRYAYYITPQGFAEKSRLTTRYLAASFEFMRRARIELEGLFADGVLHGHARFVVVGQGDLADVASLVAPRTQAQIVATISGEREAAALRSALAATAFDRVMVTAIDYPQDVFSAAVAAFGAERVCAPRLLRVRFPQNHPAGGANDS